MGIVDIAPLGGASLLQMGAGFNPALPFLVPDRWQIAADRLSPGPTDTRYMDRKRHCALDEGIE